MAETLAVRRDLEIEIRFSRNTKLNQHSPEVFVVIILIFKNPLGKRKEVLWAKK